MQIVAIVGILMPLLFMGHPAIRAEETPTIDCTFSVIKTTQGSCVTPRQSQADASAEDQVPCLAITVLAQNSSINKKFDISAPFHFFLKDEFNNEYHELSRPLSLTETFTHSLKSYPSFYPGDFFLKTIYFEFPVAVAKSLQLAIQHPEINNNISEILIFPFDKDKVLLWSEIKMEITKESPNINIISPKPGEILEQGQMIHFSMIITGMLPKRIILTLLNNTFQDDNPKENNIYDINIPLNQTPGGYTANIVVSWSNDEVSSLVVPFFVKEVIPWSALLE